MPVMLCRSSNAASWGFTILEASNNKPHTFPRTKIHSVESDTEAARAGLIAGDIISSAEGQYIRSFSQLKSLIVKALSLRLTIERKASTAASVAAASAATGGTEEVSARRLRFPLPPSSTDLPQNTKSGVAAASSGLVVSPGIRSPPPAANNNNNNDDDSQQQLQEEENVVEDKKTTSNEEDASAMMKLRLPAGPSLHNTSTASGGSTTDENSKHLG